MNPDSDPDTSTPDSNTGDDPRVFYAEAVYGEAEKEAVNNVLKNPTQLVGGEYTTAFESEVASLFGKPHGVMTNSGSSALLLAIESLELSRDAEVITPLTTFSTTVTPLVKNDVLPVFVDVDIGSYQVTVDNVKDAITEKTEAILIPSLIGNIPNWPALADLAETNDLYVIEDSADTIGATIQGTPTGEYTDVSVTSFYGSHIITAFGGGGMVCFNDHHQMTRAKKLRGWGRKSAANEDITIDERLTEQRGEITYDSKFLFDHAGYNFLPLEASAAFGLEQLNRLDDFIDARKQNFETLTTFFRQYDDWFILPVERDDVDTAWHSYPLTITENAPFTRVELVKHLEYNNIQTRSLWTGNILKHPGFQDIDCRVHDTAENADYIMENSFVIGCHQALDETDLKYMQSVFTEFLTEHTARTP